MARTTMMTTSGEAVWNDMAPGFQNMLGSGQAKYGKRARAILGSTHQRLLQRTEQRLNSVEMPIKQDREKETKQQRLWLMTGAAGGHATAGDLGARCFSSCLAVGLGGGLLW